MSWVKIVYRPTGLAAHGTQSTFELPQQRTLLVRTLNSIVQEMIDKGDPATCTGPPLTSMLLVQLDGQQVMFDLSTRSSGAKSRNRRKTKSS